MLKKGLILLTLLVVMAPMLAFSYSLTTRINNSAGQIVVNGGTPQTTLGVVTKFIPNGTVATIVITPAANYIISKIQQGGSYIAIPGNGTITIPNTNTKSQTINVWFAKQMVSVTATAGVGGSVSPAGTRNYQQGKSVSYKFTPALGNNVVGISGVPAGATVTPALPAPTNTPVIVSFAATNVTMNGVFLGVIANAGAPQTVMVGSTVTLNGSASTGATGYAWTQTSGPGVTLTGATTSQPTFSATVAGSYLFKLVVNGTSTAYTSVVVTASQASAARNACANCHIPLGAGGAGSANAFYGWSSSTHRANNVLCTTCHVGSDTGGHPGVAVTAATCESCHAAALPTSTHPADLTASKCLVCHDAHNPAQGIADLTPSNHPAVTLYTFEEVGMQMAGGAKVPVQVDAFGKGMPYSPKQTCGTAGCHVKNGVDYTYDKISDHAFHSNQGRSEMQDSSNGKFDATKNKPWLQSTAMVGKW